MFLVATCPACDAPGPGPCARCRSGLRPIGPIDPMPRGLDWCVAAFAYDGVGRRLVTSFKYGNQRCALPWMAAVLVAMVERGPGSSHPDLVVTWVPATPTHRRARGFDQAALLARAMARRLDRPCRPLLARSPGPSQTGRGRLGRLEGPGLRARGRVPPAVLVVDDVLTTGASMSAAADALHAGGASVIGGSVLALTERFRTWAAPWDGSADHRPAEPPGGMLKSGPVGAEELDTSV
jgi:predicted amidophosphoribosyltransferase